MSRQQLTNNTNFSGKPVPNLVSRGGGFQGVGYEENDFSGNGGFSLQHHC